MSNSRQVSASTKSRNKNQLRRVLLLESLETRNLMASDLDVVAKMSGDEAGVNLALTSVSSQSQMPVEQIVTYSSSQAERLLLSDDPSDVFYDYGRQRIKLPGGPESSWRVETRNAELFAATPQVDDGQLSFRLSGKPGVSGSALIALSQADELLPSLVYRIDLANEATEGFPAVSVGANAAATDWSLGDGEGEFLLGSGSGSGPTPTLTLSTVDSTAEEPHRIFCEATATTGSFQIDRTDWYGGYVTLKLSNAAPDAKWGVDFDIGGSVGSGSGGGGLYDVNPFDGPRVTFYLPYGTTPYELYVIALGDATEPGGKDQQNDTENASETARIEWEPNQGFNANGTANVQILDELEKLNITAQPSTTSELGGPEAQVKVSTPANRTMCQPIRWQVQDPSPTGSEDTNVATMGADYSVEDERSRPPYFEPLLFNPPAVADAQYPRLIESIDRSFVRSNEFILYVKANPDTLLEGTENAKFRVFVPALNPPNGPVSLAYTDFVNVEITEEYNDANTQKDEKAGCSCSCTTCNDGTMVTVDTNESSVEAVIADGAITVRTDNQNGANPVVNVGVKLPAGKAVPTSITAQLQVIEKRTDALGAPIGLGRKLATNATASPTITFQVPAGATAGSTLWFAMQGDLSNQVESWTRNATMSSGSSGINEKLVPLEVLVNATFAATVPVGQKHSGWVGRATQLLRNPNQSSLAPDFGRNLSVTGVDRMIRNTQIALPDGAGTGGKVKWETGSMLVRANGGSSWFTGNAGSAPDSQDMLAGNTLTDRYQNKKRFSAVGDMTEFEDAAGNKTIYTYGANGALTNILDARGQSTTFTYNAVARQMTITTVNGTDNRSRFLTWTPITVSGGSLRVVYDDPDGTGPRKAREDLLSYNNAGFLTSIRTGEVGGTVFHTTSLSHNVTFTSVGGWLIPTAGNRRVASVTYPDLSTVTIDIARQTNSLVNALSSGTILSTDPRALRIDPIGGSTSLVPSYSSITVDRVGVNDLQRTIVQLDHRGRVLRSWDPEQVFAMGLMGTLGTAQFNILQASAARSYELTRKATTRDSFGRVTGEDFGEVLTQVTPAQYVGGPRQTTTWTMVNNNPITQQRPLQNVETFAWNETFDVLTQGVDANGNTMTQTLDSLGRVTRRKQQQQLLPSPFLWQNPLMPADVNNDGFVSPIDALTIINYLNSTGSTPVPPAPAAPPPYYDVSGDNFISPIDALIVINAINAGNTGPEGQQLTASQVDLQYNSAPGIPNTLVTQQTIKTGRATGDQVVQYQYYTNSPTPAINGKLQQAIESSGGVSAITQFAYDGRGNLTTITDPVGRVTKMWYDKRDRLIARMSPDPDGAGVLLPVLERFDYDVFDNVIAQELVNSWVDGSLLRVTALKTSYTYDNGNRVTQEISQRPSLNWYLSASGSTITQSSTLPLVSSNVTVANLEAYAASNAAIINTPLSSAANQGLRTVYSYFGTNNEISVTQSNAGVDPRVSKVTVDRLDRVTKTVTPAPVSGAFSVVGEQLEGGGYVTRYEYDALSNLTKVTDALGKQTINTYDLLNRITKSSEPNPIAGASFDTNYAYTSTLKGWKIATTNPAGETIDVQTDMLGRVVEVSGATSKVSTNYWIDGLVKSSTDELNRITNFNYDARGRLTSMLAPTVGSSQPTTSYQYTLDSLVSSVTDPVGRISTLSYDAGGRLLSVTEPDPDGAGIQAASVTSYTRDALGNVLRTINGLGNATSITSRDSWFRPLSQQDPSGVTSMTYDVFGNTLSVTDPIGNQTTYAYNKQNRLVTETKVGTGGNRSYTYDAVGNVRTLVDRNARTTTWNYDKLYRPISETWSTTGTSINYVYDAANRLTSITDTSSSAPDFSYVYDTRGQLQLESQSHELAQVGGTLNQSILFDRDYNAVGDRTVLESNLGGAISGSSISGGVFDFRNVYTFDALHRMTSVTQTNRTGANAVAPKLTAFYYNAASQLTDMRRYNSTSLSAANLKVHTRMGYDQAGRLTSITHGKSEIAAGEMWNGTSTTPPSLIVSTVNNMLSAYNVSYDRANRVTNFASWRDAFSTSYTYNNSDQLLGATSTQIAGLALPFPLPATETYRLDANGNRQTPLGGSQSALGTHNRLQTDGTYNYLYDNEGNVTQRTHIVTGQVTLYSWDQRNRLISQVDKVSATGAITKRVDFSYDAFDQRVGKRVDSNGNGVWDRFEEFIWADGQEVLRLVDSDGVEAGSTQPYRIANRYVWGALDQLLADEQYTGNTGFAIGSVSPNASQGNTLWALTDNLGSVRDLVDNNGVVRQHVVFDSFGRRLREVDYNTGGTQIASTDPAAVDTLFGYTGRDWDKDIGLQYNRARWYDPNTGRWLSQDPIGFAAGDANLFRYVGNQPTKYIDPSGLVEDPAAAPTKREKAERRLRDLIIKNTKDGKVVDIGDNRNSKYWRENADGSYVTDSPVDAIKDIWNYEGGTIYCQKYSALIMYKSLIDLAEEAKRNGHASGQEVLDLLNKILKGGVIPNDFDGLIEDYIEAPNSDGIPTDQLLPGDQIWIKNPHYRRPTNAKERKAFAGEEGSNLFYGGEGNVVSIYKRKTMSMEQYKRGMCDWNTAKGQNPSESDFVVMRVRRMATPSEILRRLRAKAKEMQ